MRIFLFKTTYRAPKELVTSAEGKLAIEELKTGECETYLIKTTRGGMYAYNNDFTSAIACTSTGALNPYYMETTAVVEEEVAVEGVVKPVMAETENVDEHTVADVVAEIAPVESVETPMMVVDATEVDRLAEELAELRQVLMLTEDKRVNAEHALEDEKAKAKFVSELLRGISNVTLTGEQYEYLIVGAKLGYSEHGDPVGHQGASGLVEADE